MTGRIVRSRYSMPDDHPIPAPDDIMVGARDHWRIVEVEPVDSAKFVNQIRVGREQLGRHHGVYDFLGHGATIRIEPGGDRDISVWFESPLDSHDIPPDLLR